METFELGDAWILSKEFLQRLKDLESKKVCFSCLFWIPSFTVDLNNACIWGNCHRWPYEGRFRIEHNCQCDFHELRSNFKCINCENANLTIYDYSACSGGYSNLICENHQLCPEGVNIMIRKKNEIIKQKFGKKRSWDLSNDN